MLQGLVVLHKGLDSPLKKLPIVTDLIIATRAVAHFQTGILIDDIVLGGTVVAFHAIHGFFKKFPGLKACLICQAIASLGVFPQPKIHIRRACSPSHLPKQVKDHRISVRSFRRDPDSLQDLALAPGIVHQLRHFFQFSVHTGSAAVVV